MLKSDTFDDENDLEGQKMVSLNKKQEQVVCPKTGKPLKHERKRHWVTWLFPVSGFAALVWFLIRVIPKPSRAAYPCQRVVFPLASGFVIWFAGAMASIAAVRRAKRYMAQSRYVLCVILVAISIGAIWFAQSVTTEEALYADEPVSNAPILAALP